MVSLTLITVGTLKESYLTEGIAEYRKRLLPYARWNEVNLHEERIADEDDPAQVKRALEAEGERILRAVPEGAYLIALCVEGKEMPSEELAAVLDRACTERGGRIAFVIGSSHGLCDRVKHAADLRLSVSRLTFPHQLMRLMLGEILYRSFTILAGKKYHK